MKHTSFIGNIDPQAFDALYQQYQHNPELVEPGWRHFFEGFDFSKSDFKPSQMVASKEFNVVNLIEGYRKRGHLFTKTNPVRQRRKYSPTLDLRNFDLSETDLETPFEAAKLIGLPRSPLKEIVSHLEQTYCQSIGVEYKFVRNVDVVRWIETRIEGQKCRRDFSIDEKKHLFMHLNQAVAFEQFIVRKFPGQKSFSLEGGEGLVPLMDQLIEFGSTKGIEEFVIGMAHRGRLNVLANILKKPHRDIFTEFNAISFADGLNVGDVKYHMGYNNSFITHAKKRADVHLLPNPSHLETVTPVAQGVARALIGHKHDGNFDKVLPIVIHGDSAVAAQGVVYETVQMANLEGYTNGGSLHLVINNQVGFTTNYTEARSSTYCTDVAKVTQSPVFHVNADDLESLVYVLELAIEFRQKWHRDVFIDLLGYRKHGHNEGDEPRFTQPALYKAIAQHPNPAEIYAKKLIAEQSVDAEYIENEHKRFEIHLEEEFAQSQQNKTVNMRPFMAHAWQNFRFPTLASFGQPVDTRFDKQKLTDFAIKANSFSESDGLFRKTLKIKQERVDLAQKNKADWALAEQLAYATLLSEGFGVRISGQDSVRGTFSHRHAAVLDENSERRIFALREKLGFTKFQVYNSLLSEYGVLGFEYGHALASPETLTIWEAQFGDFVNTAQVIIDQYIVSAGEKWGNMNGLTLYLPHGYEGQGAEHSSARMERFLALAADENMSVANCTTPANLFHLIRRQMKRNFRVPLVLFTPKSLLRHPKVVSTLDQLAYGAFEPVIDDPETQGEVTRVVFCTGKIYFDLLAEKEKLQASDVALIRIEELYPFPKDHVEALIKKYHSALIWLWVQEEPENMGAWNFIRDQINLPELKVVARRRTATTAVGLQAIHKLEQQEIVQKVFKPCTCERKLKYCGLQCVSGKERVRILKQREYLMQLKDNML